MRTVLLLALAACGDNIIPEVPELPDAAVDASTLTTCERLELETEPAPDIGEVRVDVRMITPGVSFTCDGITTWSQYPRRMNGAVGTYGRIDVGSTVCEWRDAIETRTPATGRCP